MTEEQKQQTRERIGQRVKALRLLAGLSQDELAQRAGLQRTHIGRIEGASNFLESSLRATPILSRYATAREMFLVLIAM